MDVFDLTGTPWAPTLAEVSDERQRQDDKWGEQNHPDTHPEWGYRHRRDYEAEADAQKANNERRVSRGSLCWDGILLEEVYEALAESDPAKLRAELVQVAAVCVAWIEAIDRRVAEAEADLAASPWPGTDVAS